MTNRFMAGRFVVDDLSGMYHTTNRGGPRRFVRNYRSAAPAQPRLSLRRGPARPSQAEHSASRTGCLASGQGHLPLARLADDGQRELGQAVVGRGVRRISVRSQREMSVIIAVPVLNVVTGSARMATTAPSSPLPIIPLWRT